MHAVRVHRVLEAAVRLEAARADVTRAIAPPGRLTVGLTPLAWSDPVAEPAERLAALLSAGT
jgi:hypothetical protein